MTMERAASLGKTVTVSGLASENPRWCAGCGNYGILGALKRFIVERQLSPESIVNISGIGCSGRTPHYVNTWGVHSLHGRPITIGLGLALTRPDLHLFIHSGDGDALSIGGNHLLHGINKNFKCVFLLYNNELYALTRNQSSPTTRKDRVTSSQPNGTPVEPINPTALALGLGASFVASTADWLQEHLSNTLAAAFDHPGFAFVHIAQRCVHFDVENFDTKSSAWFGFLQHAKGIPPEARLAAKAELIDHDPADLGQAFARAVSSRRYFGLFYRNIHKPRYDEILRNKVQTTKQKNRSGLLEAYRTRQDKT